MDYTVRFKGMREEIFFKVLAILAQMLKWESSGKEMIRKISFKERKGKAYDYWENVWDGEVSFLSAFAMEEFGKKLKGRKKWEMGH